MSTSISDFKSFLEQVKEQTHVFKELEGIIKHAENALPLEMPREETYIEDISREFYQKAESTKTAIDELAQSDADILLNKKKAAHINALYTKLRIYINRFTKMRKDFLLEAEEHKQIYVQEGEYLSSSVYSKTNKHIYPLPTTSASSTSITRKNKKNNDLNILLASLSELEVLSIELNTIIESSTETIDRVSLETIKSNSKTQCANKTMQHGIIRRNRMRNIKRVFLLVLLLILLTIIFIFFRRG